MLVFAWLLFGWPSHVEGFDYQLLDDNSSDSEAQHQGWSYVKRDFEPSSNLILTQQRLFLLDSNLTDVVIYNRQVNASQPSTMLELSSYFSQHVSNPLAYDVMAASDDLVVAANTHSTARALHILEWVDEYWASSTLSLRNPDGEGGITHLAAYGDRIAVGMLGDNNTRNSVFGRVQLFIRTAQGLYKDQELPAYTDPFHRDIVIGYQMAMSSQGLLLSVHRPGRHNMDGILCYPHDAYAANGTLLPPEYVEISSPIDSNISGLVTRFGSVVVHAKTDPIKVAAFSSGVIYSSLISGGASASNGRDQILVVQESTLYWYMYNPISGAFDAARRIRLQLTGHGAVFQRLFIEMLRRASLSVSRAEVAIGVQYFGVLVVSIPRATTDYNISGVTYLGPDLASPSNSIPTTENIRPTTAFTATTTSMQPSSTSIPLAGGDTTLFTVGTSALPYVTSPTDTKNSTRSLVHNQQLLILLVLICFGIFTMLALLLWRRRRKRTNTLQLLNSSTEELAMVLPKEHAYEMGDSDTEMDSFDPFAPLAVAVRPPSTAQYPTQGYHPVHDAHPIETNSPHSETLEHAAAPIAHPQAAHLAATLLSQLRHHSNNSSVGTPSVSLGSQHSHASLTDRLIRPPTTFTPLASKPHSVGSRSSSEGSRHELVYASSLAASNLFVQGAHNMLTLQLQIVSMIARGNFEAVESFAKNHPALFRVADTRGLTILHHLGEVVLNRSQAATIVSLVLRTRASLDQPDLEGRTPLMTAAALGNSPLLLALRDNGANVHLVDDLGRTALVHAVLSDDLGSVEVLLLSYTIEEQHILDYSGHAAIHWALRVSKLAIISELVRNDDTALVLRASNGDNCIHLLVREQRLEVFEAVLKLNRSQARLQLLNVNDHLLTPRQLAQAMGIPSLVTAIDAALRELQPEGDLDFEAIRKKLDHAERMRKFRRKNRARSSIDDQEKP